MFAAAKLAEATISRPASTVASPTLAYACGRNLHPLLASTTKNSTASEIELAPSATETAWIPSSPSSATNTAMLVRPLAT